MGLAVTGPKFTPDILNSYPALLDFFSGTKEIQEIRQEATQEISPIDNSPNLLSRWQVVQLKVSSPFVKLYAVVMRCLRELFFSLGLRIWALQAGAQQKLWEKDRRLETWEHYGMNCLSFSINAHSPSSEDVYLEPSRQVENVRDAGVRNIIHPRLEELVFYRPLGCCRGMSEWFFYLYFQTKIYFADETAHLKAVGKQFQNGASSQASLLQSLYTENRGFLGLRTGASRLVTKGDSRDATCKHVIEVFNNLEPGAYAIGFHKHRINYIHQGENRGYVFDPNHGVIAIENQEGMDKFADLTTRHAIEEESILLDITKIESL